jgi:CheY-like chemotaxis protein
MDSNFAGVQILLAEDNPADVVLIREALSVAELRCDLKVLRDGQSAIEFMEAGDRDRSAQCSHLLVLDVSLPKQSGGAVLRRARSLERYQHTPAILMSGVDSPETRKLIESDGGCHFFLKPSSFSEFLQLGRIIREIVSATPHLA